MCIHPYTPKNLSIDPNKTEDSNPTQLPSASESPSPTEELDTPKVEEKTTPQKPNLGRFVLDCFLVVLTCGIWGLVLLLKYKIYKYGSLSGIVKKNTDLLKEIESCNNVLLEKDVEIQKIKQELEKNSNLLKDFNHLQDQFTKASQELENFNSLLGKHGNLETITEKLSNYIFKERENVSLEIKNQNLQQQLDDLRSRVSELDSLERKHGKIPEKLEELKKSEERIYDLQKSLQQLSSQLRTYEGYDGERTPLLKQLSEKLTSFYSDKHSIELGNIFEENIQESINSWFSNYPEITISHNKKSKKTTKTTAGGVPDSVLEFTTNRGLKLKTIIECKYTHLPPEKQKIYLSIPLSENEKKNSVKQIDDGVKQLISYVDSVSIDGIITIPILVVNTPLEKGWEWETKEDINSPILFINDHLLELVLKLIHSLTTHWNPIPTLKDLAIVSQDKKEIELLIRSFYQHIQWIINSFKPLFEKISKLPETIKTLSTAVSKIQSLKDTLKDSVLKKSNEKFNPFPFLEELIEIETLDDEFHQKEPPLVNKLSKSSDTTKIDEEYEKEEDS